MMNGHAATNGHASQHGSPLRIAVVGGGIGGLALALGLANRQREGANLEFKVFEAAAQFKEIGAGVGIGPNSFKAIHLLGLGQPYAKLAFTHDPEESGIYFIWRWGEKDQVQAHGGEDKIGETPCFVKGGHTTVHRAHFLDMMIDRLPEGVAQFNKRLLRYELSLSDEDAPVKLYFADGSTHVCDLLIGADGIKSAIRPQLLGDLMPEKKLKPRFTGTTVYRALMPMEEIVAKIGEKARKGTMYLGKDKHILTFPIQEGKILNVVCFASDRTPSPDDPIWNSDNWIVDSTEEEMLQGWEGWSDDCLAIMKGIRDPKKWGLHELYDLPTHARGPVCIMGDAAAATLPHQGQGAAQAIESAYVLSTLLSSPHLDRSNASEALAVFDQLRRERVTGVKTTSHELGKILEFSDGTIDGDKEALQKNLRERYSWMWEWNGADAQEGLQILEKRLN